MHKYTHRHIYAMYVCIYSTESWIDRAPSVLMAFVQSVLNRKPEPEPQTPAPRLGFMPRSPPKTQVFTSPLAVIAPVSSPIAYDHHDDDYGQESSQPSVSCLSTSSGSCTSTTSSCGSLTSSLDSSASEDSCSTVDDDDLVSIIRLNNPITTNTDANINISTNNLHNNNNNNSMTTTALSDILCDHYIQRYSAASCSADPDTPEAASSISDNLDVPLETFGVFEAPLHTIETNPRDENWYIWEILQTPKEWTRVDPAALKDHHEQQFIGWRESDKQKAKKNKSKNKNNNKQDTIIACNSNSNNNSECTVDAADSITTILPLKSQSQKRSEYPEMGRTCHATPQAQPQSQVQAQVQVQAQAQAQAHPHQQPTKVTVTAATGTQTLPPLGTPTEQSEQSEQIERIEPDSLSSHVRAVRANESHLRMIVAEVNMMRANKIVCPLKPRAFLAKRSDRFLSRQPTPLRNEVPGHENANENENGDSSCRPAFLLNTLLCQDRLSMSKSTSKQYLQSFSPKTTTKTTKTISPSESSSLSPSYYTTVQA
ncbi:hypothetical protein F4703DRAFT_1126192 [Phycomyces blakesleeanus]